MKNVTALPFWYVSTIAASAFAQSPTSPAPTSTSAPDSERAPQADAAAPASPDAQGSPQASAEPSALPPPEPAAAPAAPSNGYFFADASAAPRWKLNDSRLIIGAENISNIEGFHRTYYDANDVKTGEVTGTDVHFLYPGDAVRLSADFARVGTIGGSFGYRANPRTSTSGARAEFTNSTSSWELGVRGGVLLGDSSTFGIWLRGGYERRGISSGTGSSGAKQRISVDVISFDPRFIFVPAPHVGLAVGPYVTVAYGSAEFDNNNVASYWGFAGGLSLSLYAFIGG